MPTVVIELDDARRAVKHEEHDQSSHGNWADRGEGRSRPETASRSTPKRLRNQEDPIDPATAWVHETEWFHGTSRPELRVVSAREGQSRYPGMDSGYALRSANFATSSYERALEYARAAYEEDEAKGVEGVYPVVYVVRPTSDAFDPDPNSGPMGWGDGPADMDEAFELADVGSEVSLRFYDEMDVVDAIDGLTGKRFVSGTRKHQEHDQQSHGNWADRGGLLDGVPFGSDLDSEINYYMVEPNPPQVLYHVAPRAARDDIVRNGLDATERTWNTGEGIGDEYRDEHLWTTSDEGEEFAYEYRPTGVYMFADLDRAIIYARSRGEDIYRIDTEANDREIIRDPSSARDWEYVDPPDRAWVTRYVEPAALTLVKPTKKHQEGEHDQQSHGNWARGLPEGWTSTVVDARVDVPSEDFKSYGTAVETFYSHAESGTLVMVQTPETPDDEGIVPPVKQEHVNRLLTLVADLQRIAPYRDARISVREGVFRNRGVGGENVYGMTTLRQPGLPRNMWLRPAAISTGVDHGNGHLMDAYRNEPWKYTLVHEWGHLLDQRTDAVADFDKAEVLNTHQTGMSRYASMPEPRSEGREAFAEAFVGWMSTQGRSTLPFVRYFAERYGWDAGGDGRPPSVPLAKAAGDLVIFDTFGAEGPIQVVDDGDELRKHEDHDQRSHGNWARYGAARQQALAERAREIASAQGRGDDTPLSIGDMLRHIESEFPSPSDEWDDVDEDTLQNTLDAMYEFSHGEFEVSIVDTQTGVNGVRVMAGVEDSMSGEPMGMFTHVLKDDGTAYLSFMTLEEDAQGSGFGTAFMRHLENGFIVTGIESIELQAGLSQGKYVWPRMGYDFASDLTAMDAVDTLEELVNSGAWDDEYGEVADLVERAENGDYPTAYEISQVGRLPDQDPKTRPWLGYALLQQMPNFAAVKDLRPAAAEYRRKAGVEKANKVNVAVAKAFEDWIMYCEQTYPAFNPERPTRQQLADEFRIYGERLVGLIG